MSLADRLNQGAAVAKWKVDQQARILRLRNEISGSENTVRVHKARLADKVLDLFSKKHFQEKNINELCKTILDLQKEIEKLSNKIEETKKEEPPHLEFYISSTPDKTGNKELSGLQCPQCGRALVGNFCPEHGVEGVPASPKSPKASAKTETTKKEREKAKKVCPVCGDELNGKFCPKHGVEGVSKQ